MTRVQPLELDALTDEQRLRYDEIAATRDGNVGGPFLLWLRHPRLADPKNQLSNALRVTGNLDRRVFELAVLVTTRFWSAQYAWSVHARDGLKAGLSEAMIEAIRLGRVPQFDADDQRCVYELANELLERRALSDVVYERALAVFGYDQLIELVAVIGNYTMTALALVAFEVEPRDGSEPLPPLGGTRPDSRM